MTTHETVHRHDDAQGLPAVGAADAPYGLQAQGSPWWKGLLSIVAIVAAYLLVNLLFMMPALTIANLLDLQGQVNAATMAGLNLTWGAMIFIAPLIMRLVHGVPRGAMSSVGGGFRWGRLGRALLWVVPLYAVSTVVVTLVGPSTGNGVVTPALLGILAVCLVTTPLQAAGEEYVFRGALNASAASWGRTQRSALIIGAVVSTLIFGAAHGASDPWLAVYYTAFGLGAWVLTRLTGGLEVSVAVHAVNNLLLFVAGTVAGMDPNAMFDRSAGRGGPFMLLPIVTMVVACLITWALSRRQRSPRPAGATEQA